MPYNKLARTKYAGIGREDRYTDMGDLGEKDMERVMNSFTSRGIVAHLIS